MQYTRIRKNLANHIEKLSKNPKDKEIQIMELIKTLNMLDAMIRKAKFLPNI